MPNMDHTKLAKYVCSCWYHKAMAIWESYKTRDWRVGQESQWLNSEAWRGVRANGGAGVDIQPRGRRDLATRDQVLLSEPTLFTVEESQGVAISKKLWQTKEEIVRTMFWAQPSAKDVHKADLYLRKLYLNTTSFFTPMFTDSNWK